MHVNTLNFKIQNLGSNYMLILNNIYFFFFFNKGSSLIVAHRASPCWRRAPTFPLETSPAFLWTWRILSLYPNCTGSGLSDRLPRCLWWPKYSSRQSCMNRSVRTYGTPCSNRNLVHSTRLLTVIFKPSKVWIEINIRAFSSLVKFALLLMASFQSMKYLRNVSVNHVKRESSEDLYGARRGFCFRRCSWVDRTLQQSKKSFIIWQKLAVSETSSSGILLRRASAIDLERTCTAKLTFILANDVKLTCSMVNFGNWWRPNSRSAK